ncbi:MAG: carboxypeptidase regulatory-like domain-containing protein [Acidobacteria bacterium]|nr:carboxypeptidase regulatory-like domain-containing protein [Acidobacteriota bacterium]
MYSLCRKLALSTAGLLLFAAASFAQTSSLEGDVKGFDGAPLKGALVKIERKDIKGNYKVKTDKKGHYFHAGLPLGSYKITVEVDGKDVDSVDNVRTRLGDPTPVDFNLQASRQRQEALSAAAASGSLSKEQARDMSPEQRAAVEKAMKDREQALAKNKALNDAFNQGMEAMKTKQFDVAITAFTKATELDAKQHVVWAQLAEAYMQLGGTKTGADQEAAYGKGLEAYAKAMELKPEDAAYHNNFALALAKAKKFDQAQAELTKAAELDPPQAGRYYYNLGAVLVNTGQLEPAGAAFKKAIEADPNYAAAQYQYGVYLISKAQTTADGKVTPVPGTREAFEAYLKLDPNGPYADAAKGMIASMETSLDTAYKNPAAPAPTAKKGAKKK